jgi:hypothetical protein
MAFDPTTAARVTCLDVPHAAGLVAMHPGTIRRWALRGLLKGAFKAGTASKARWVIPIRALEKIARLPQRETWQAHPDDPELQLPIMMIARLLGLTPSGVEAALRRGALRDRQPESVGAYLRSERRKRLRLAVRTREANLRLTARRYRAIAQRTLCSECSRAVLQTRKKSIIPNANQRRDERKRP